LEAGLLWALGALARALPFDMASDLGAALGGLFWGLLGRRRRIAISNVRHAIGPERDGVKAEEIARRAVTQLGRTFVEFLALPSLGREALLERIEWVGFQPLEEWGRTKRGAILVTGHYGNWEILGAAVGMKFGHMQYVLPRQTNSRSDEYLNAVRRKLGVEPVVIGYGMRSALRALEDGVFLGMLPDQDARRVGIHVPFFGRPASTHTGPARLAYRAGAPIAVGVVERAGRGRFRARVIRILEADRTAAEESEVARLTAALTSDLELAIRERPDHWYWIHRRWKTPPRDPAQPYARLADVRT
jgi:KDO2-lipid IV(A) lauroyltransferase